MYEITVKSEFAAAHRLIGDEGKCANLHGHNWKVELTVMGKNLDKMDMLVDFRVLKKSLRDFLETLDHQYLNELPPFKDINPTTENVAKHIYNEMSKISNPTKIKQVTVWESETSGVTYYE